MGATHDGCHSYARETQHGTIGTVGLSGGLIAGVNVDSIRLALVLGRVGVERLGDVGADRGLEDGGELDIFIGAHQLAASGTCRS